MAKLILLAVVFYILYSLVKKQKTVPPPAMREEEMVRCAHCGIHLPRSECILSGGEIFCSDEHRRLHRK